MSKKRDQTAQKIIKAIKESSGLLTIAADRAGVNPATVWRYTQDYPSVKKAVEEAKEKFTDFAESKLYKKIKEEETIPILFYLKTKAKDRGYVERQEIEIPSDINIHVRYTDQTKK